ncbi:porin [Paraburkholderia caffeinilytica]|uniref:porin n=1 Tax=Paraburkholderia caffeinilytica TaxID=1761016 RepID=UPI003DA0CC16
MKKNRWRPCALAIGTIACAAHAQSSVTLAGNVDGGVRYISNGKGSVTTMNSNGLYTANRLDFLGQEDLGGNWNAHFQLETGFNTGTGALDNTTGLLFNRMSFVGIGSPYGSLDLGRQYTLGHDVLHDFDPFYFGYPSIIPLTPAADGTHFNNDIKYSGVWGPFHVGAEEALGGVAGDFNAGTAHGAGLQYKVGFFNIGGTYIHRTVLVGTAYQPDDYVAFGSELKFGTLRFAGGYMSETTDNVAPATAARTENYWGGVTYNLSYDVNLGAGYYVTNLPTSKGRKNLAIFSATYLLSKRTRLYAESDYTTYHGSYISNATLNAAHASHQLGISVGINYLF